MNDKPNFYAIIPANVRYDKRLKPIVRLLYGEITALCNDKGYCWASNSYFANLYEVANETISRYIAQLKEYGYIQIVYEKKEQNIEKRKIYIRYCQNNQYGIDRTVNTVLTEQSREYSQNCQGGIDRTVKENNTINNIKNNTGNNKQPLDFQNDSVYDDTTGYYKTHPPYELFINKLCNIQEQLLCITATGIHNLQGFKKPEARENLKKAFESRRYDWEECVELAFKNAKSKPDVSKHWLEFLGYLKIYLGNGDEKNHSIKRYYTPQELAEREAKKRQKALELEQQRLEEERKQKEQDMLEAEKMGLTLEEYYQKQEEADKDFFENLKKSLFNTYSCDSET